jgi:hypothetical protein
VVASVIALYSATVLDRDTVFCFLAHHEINLGLRNTAKPLVGFLLLVLHVQSALEKALIIVDGDD